MPRVLDQIWSNVRSVKKILRVISPFTWYFVRGRRGPSSRSANASEEEKRRLIRRQRNKEAAARCRKRRFDQTMTLEDEVSQWEERNHNAKLEIENLEAQKRHLLSLLDGHRSNEKCKLKKLWPYQFTFKPRIGFIVKKFMLLLYSLTINIFVVVN